MFFHRMMRVIYAGIGYVLHSEAVGGVGSQVLAQPICHAYGGAAVVGTTVFVPCNEGVQQLEIAADGRLTLGWQAKLVPGSPVIENSVRGRKVVTHSPNYHSCRMTLPLADFVVHFLCNSDAVM
jgi:hypothetical protein